MSDQPTIQLVVDEVTVTLRIPVQVDGELRSLTAPQIPFKVFYSVYKILNNTTIDPTDLRHLAGFAAWVAKGAPLTDAEASRLDLVLHVMQTGSGGLFSDEAWQTDEDPVISITYHLLRARKITYAEAAAIARGLLGRDIKPEAWRKRVDRWRKDRGLPEVGLRQRKRTP